MPQNLPVPTEQNAPGNAPGPLPLEVVVRTPAGAAARPPLWRRLGQRLPFIPAAMGLVAFGGVIGLYFQPPGLQWVMTRFHLEPGAGTSSPIAVPAVRLPSTSGEVAPGTPAAPARRLIAGLGVLLPSADIVAVALPFGARDARIARIFVDEGDAVSSGQMLAALDNEEQLKAAVGLMQATVNARDAALAQARNNTLASRDEARAALARAQSALANAESEFNRAEQLRKKGIVAAQAVDQKRTVMEQAREEVDRLTATLARFGDGPIDQQADVLFAFRNLETAKADLSRAQVDLEKAYVRAPLNGTVLSVNKRPGEQVGTDGLMNIADISRMKADVEIYQTQIGEVVLGQPVELTAEALSAPLKGTVSKIGLQVGRQTLVDANPAANTDARVVKVTVALDEASMRLASRYTNLQVTARISVGGQ